MSRRADRGAGRGPGRSLVRPTGRGLVALVLTPILLAGAELTGIEQLRLLGCALALALGAGLLAILLGGIGLDLRRSPRSEAVPVGEDVAVQLRLARGALIGVLPLGRGVVRCYLPSALGGHGDLPLAAVMDHRLPVRRRGVHDLGDCAVLLRDVLGMFHRRRLVPAPAQITGLPVPEELAGPGLARLGAALGAAGGGAHRSQGEPGPIARPYVPGDDIRRIHWRASARTGRLMTREEEPAAAERALIVLDTRGEGPGRGADATRREDLERARDRAVEHAASLLLALRRLGCDVTVVDASGDRIVAAERAATGGRSLGAAQAEAILEHQALLALAGVGFGDGPAAQETGGARTAARASDPAAAGPLALVIALGAATRSAGEPGDAFAGLDLDRFAGSAPVRLALGIVPGPAVATAPSGAPGSWQRLEVAAEDPLADALLALPASPGTAARRGAPAAPAGQGR